MTRSAFVTKEEAILDSKTVSVCVGYRIYSAEGRQEANKGPMDLLSSRG